MWAKRHGLDSSYPLIRHLLDTAAIAEQLFYHWLCPGLQEQITQALGAEAPRIVAAIAGIHDIGKANPLFQGQLAQSGEVWQAVRDQIAREENAHPACAGSPCLLSAYVEQFTGPQIG